MISVTDKDNCCGCSSCESACPKKCIVMVSDNDGFWYPQVDKEKCIDCGICEKVCPIIHVWEPDGNHTTNAFAAINLNEEIRLKSSSGGIFTLIAEEVLSKGGVVFGAAFTNDFRAIHHIYVESAADLDKLRGSKYVQSKIGDSYIQAKEFLDCGRKVLFTGTPCQIGGLYSFLRKPYENLYTQDIICHGVPSPMVWNKYVDEREQIAASKTQQMSFRDKKHGWKTYEVLFMFSNNALYEKTLIEDSFMRVFLSNSCLRHSCYNCSFKTIERQADVTLADFWGVQCVLPRVDDDKGTSIILIHSKKGQKLFDSVINQIKSCKIQIETVERFNPAVSKSVTMTSNRQELFDLLETKTIDEIADIISPVSKRTVIKTRLKRTRFVKLLLRAKHLVKIS